MNSETDLKEEKTIELSEQQEVIQIEQKNIEELTEIKELLQKQVDFIEAEKKEETEEQQALEEAKKKELEEAKKEEKTLLEEEQKQEELTTQQQEKVESITSSTSITADNSSLMLEQLQAISTNLEEIKTEQLHMQKTLVEGFWIVGLTIAIAIGLKIFWDHTLKW